MSLRRHEREYWKAIRTITYIHLHKPAKCKGRACVVHNPSKHHLRVWPLYFRADRGITERVCPHSVGHPDPDDMEYWNSQHMGWQGVHGCDGCCLDTEKIVGSMRSDEEPQG